MKLQYLGTSAAEGIPAIFCTCNICNTARKVRGKEIRTRSQAIVDQTILLDFGPDTFMHGLKYGLDYSNIFVCLVTHAHEDHLYRHDIICRKRNRALLAENTPPLVLYGGNGVMEALQPDTNGYVTKDGNVQFRLAAAYKQFEVQSYIITPLPAIHNTKDPFVYAIEHDGKSLLYCHDSDILSEDTLNWLHAHHMLFDLVSLDCTEGKKHINYSGHMNFERDAQMRDLMLRKGLAHDETVFVASHFSHNGLVNQSEASEFAKAIGFYAAYDGMEFTI